MPERAHSVRRQREGDPRAAHHVHGKLTRGAKALFLLGSAALLFTPGCDVGNPEVQPLDAPAPIVVEVRATVGVDDDKKPIHAAISTDVTKTSEVLSIASFTIRFDRFLLPSTITRQSVCIQSKLGPVATFADCTDGIFLEPSYDPTRREVTYRQAAEQPGLKLSAKYQLTILPPSEGLPGGFRAFDGAALAQPISYQFTTPIENPEGAALERPPSGDLFCEPKECLSDCAVSKKVAACQTACPSCAATCMCDPSDPTCTDGCPPDNAECKAACKMCRACGDTCLSTCTASCPNSIVTSLGACAFGGCHLDSKDAATGATVLGPAMGLNLSPDGIAMTALNHVAHQTQQGEHADKPDRNPQRFGRAMPLIDAAPNGAGGNPGNSYLLYKLAVGRSATGEAAADADEIARLRASLVVGMPMPPPPGGALRDVDLAALATWISQGAPMPSCQ